MREPDRHPTLLKEIPTVLPIPTVVPLELPPVGVSDGIAVAEDAINPSLPAQPGLLGVLRRLAWRIGSAAEWCFGVVALMGFLAGLAAVPIVQFLSLGYLLEASGRVARSGRLRDGFIDVRLAARAGAVVFGTWLMLLPLRLVSSLYLSAQLIEPEGAIARRWEIGLTVLTTLMLIHIGLAWACGGKVRHFLLPFAKPIIIAVRVWRGGFWAKARDAVWDFAAALRLPHYFWLGWRGFWGAFLWVAGPVTLLALGRQLPPLGFLGAFSLIIVLLYVPFLQLHFVIENRISAFLEVRTVRQRFRRAPIAFGCAFFLTLMFAVPLYLLKIEIIPRDAAWLPSLVFIAFMFPARLMSGWAFGRALRRERPRHWLFRWTMRFFMLATASAYAIIVYFSQFAAWQGIWSLYEQHAFLLPVPFLGM